MCRLGISFLFLAVTIANCTGQAPYINNGKSITPFTNAGKVFWRSAVALNDNAAFGVPANSFHLITGQSLKNGEMSFERAILRTPSVGKGRWCLKFGEKRSNSCITVSFDIGEFSGIASALCSYEPSKSWINRIAVNVTASSQAFFEISATGFRPGKWEHMLDTVVVAAC